MFPQVRPELHSQGLTYSTAPAGGQKGLLLLLNKLTLVKQLSTSKPVFQLFWEGNGVIPLDPFLSFPAALVKLEGRSHQPHQCQKKQSTSWNCFSRARPLPLRLIHKPPAFSQVAKDSAVKDRGHVHSGLTMWNRKVSEEQLAQELEEKTKKSLFKRKMPHCSIINGKQKRFYGLIEK